MVYIEEAHASDMWQLPTNLRDKVVFASPKEYGEREALAGACVRQLGLEVPALVDGLDNNVERNYTSWPDRIYAIDKAGRVAFKSAPGPFGFRPQDLRKVLESGKLW